MSYKLYQIPVFWDNINNPEYLNVLNDYLFVTQNYQTNNRDFIGGMPVTLENDCFKQLLRLDADKKFVYNITLKVDGERYLLFLSTYGSLYLIDRRLNFYIFIEENGNRLPNILIKPFLFDGELIKYKRTDKYEFLLFDCLFYQGESFIEQNYYTRFDVITQAYSKVFSGYFSNNNISVSVKRWFPITDIAKTNNIYEYIKSKTNENRSKQEQLFADGLILQPFDTSYVISGPWNKFNNVLFKWKPADEQTMDFKIKIEGPNKWVLLTRSGYPFTMPVTGEPAVCKPTEANKRDFSDGDVAEFIFNDKSGFFKIVRARPNKEANSKDSVLSIFNFIKNPFTLDQLAPVFKSMLSGKDISGLLGGVSKSHLILCILSDKLFFTDRETKNIKTFYDTFKQNEKSELEFRLVKKGRKDSSVDKSIFNYILEYMVSNYVPQRKYTIDILSRKDEPTIRSTYSSFEEVLYGRSILNQSKRSLLRPYISEENKQGLYNNIIFKLALSEELESKKTIPLITEVDGKNIYNLIRIKDRISFEIGNLWRIDMTIVKSGYSIQEAQNKNETFEIECEFIGSIKNISFNSFLKSFSKLYILLLENASYC